MSRGQLHLSAFLSGFLAAGAIVIGVIMGLSSCGGEKKEQNAVKVDRLVLAAYTVPKEAYEKEIIPAFQKDWQKKTGRQLVVEQSYEASGAQARAVVGGFEADVVALSLEGDVDKVTDAGLITHDWKANPRRGIITRSVVAIGYRDGQSEEHRGLGGSDPRRCRGDLPQPEDFGRCDVVRECGLRRRSQNVGGRDGTRGLRVGAGSSQTCPEAREGDGQVGTRIRDDVRTGDRGRARDVRERASAPQAPGTRDSRSSSPKPRCSSRTRRPSSTRTSTSTACVSSPRRSSLFFIRTRRSGRLPVTAFAR